jgi:hypothetical protein
MALIRSPSTTIYRIGNTGSDVPVLPRGGTKDPLGSSLGRTSAELPPSSPRGSDAPHPSPSGPAGNNI